MDNFIVKRKRQDSWSEQSAPTPGPSNSTHKEDKRKKRTYQDSYLAYGFTWNKNEEIHIPVCLVCGETFGNGTMIPSKLKRHLTTKRPSVSQKSVIYFSRILEGEKKTAVRMVKRMTIGCQEVMKEQLFGVDHVEMLTTAKLVNKSTLSWWDVQSGRLKNFWSTLDGLTVNN